MLCLLHFYLSDVPPGPEPTITAWTNEWVDLRCLPPVRKEEEAKEEKSELDKLVENKATVRCNNCGEAGHWSLKCPKRRELGPQSASQTAAAAASGGGNSGSGDSGSNKWVPSFRSRDGNSGGGGGGADGGQSSSGTTDITIKISNLQDDTTDNDLRVLLSEVASKFRIDTPSRSFLVKDKVTYAAKGYAYVTYLRQDDANKALKALDGYRFANVVLQAELSASREDRPQRHRGGDDGGGDRYDDRGQKDFSVSGGRSVPWRK